MSQLAAAEEMLGSFDAAYKPRVEAIADALWEKYPGLTQVAPTPIHSAFRLSQWLLVNGKLALIDFDTFLLGNPISDVASFVAHLMYLQLKGKLAPEQSRSAIRRFCRAYAERAPWGLPADVLAWQTAAHLVAEQAKKCIRLAKKNCRHTVEQLLSLAADIILGKSTLM
jgi:aminoglycoside phosphotransferase (APT) family kinase protein